MTISHLQGMEIVRRAIPSITDKESLILRALSVLESGGYGNGWRAFTPAQKQQWGAELAKDGIGSNNWGAITAGGSWANGPTFDSPDHYVDGVGKRHDYVGKFRVYGTPEDGAIDLYRIAFKPNVKTAAALGDILGVSRAMKDNNYYGGNKITGAAREKLIQDHAGKIHKYIASIMLATSEPDPFIVVPPITPPVSTKDSTGKIVVFGALLVLAYLVWRKPKRTETES